MFRYLANTYPTYYSDHSRPKAYFALKVIAHEKVTASLSLEYDHSLRMRFSVDLIPNTLFHGIFIVKPTEPFLPFKRSHPFD